ncbi:sulfite exporter TauE/SafE family protein [Rhabdaerophilum sp. SD176]|uniref:sulfite exporter TauE/SafE family protein n=1 Tax=Rhabdaerophilum sp. SD176 TaxID=2983548 RepID=UPI0024DFBFF9|nr:sulfite exporter TauE/SafE family protein [Rhabdaerophilum sp. SD176]
MFGIPVSDLLPLVVALLAAGLLTGLLAGMFGVGGGAVIVPVLYQIFGLLNVPESVRMHLCVGTSLAIIIPTSIQSFRTHYGKGKVLMDVLRLWAVPVVLSVMAGGVIAAYAPALVLKLVFVAVAGSNAIKLLSGRDDWRIAPDLPGPVGMRAYGVLIGLASSLMGIGGGAISNMILALHGKAIHNAVATSSGLGVLISIPGALAYIWAGWPHLAELPPLSLGFVSILGFALIAPTSTFVAPYGARLAHSMPKRRLEIAFGVFLLLVSLRFLYGLVA